MKVLIVDDQEEGRYLTEKILTGYGNEVKTASHGKEALEKLRDTPFDLILSDILMPVMDGYSLCREVRKQKETKNIPFIFFTATYTDEKDEELALKLGADAFIRKNQGSEEFYTELRRAMVSIKNRKSVPEYVAGDTEAVYNLYNERLVKKLEKKTLQLEEEVHARIEAENNLRRMVEEKELLLKELHHRVKNNMQLILSLLNLQINTNKNPVVNDVLLDVMNRIHSMALIHEQVYKSNLMGQINIRNYLQSLIYHIRSMYESCVEEMRINFQSCDLEIPIKTAISCGLIVNEILTNVFKHAFPEKFHGRKNVQIKIDLNDGNNRLDILIRDTGIGINPRINLQNPETMGLKMIRLLTIDQLQGNLNISLDKGTEFRLSFPV